MRQAPKTNPQSARQVASPAPARGSAQSQTRVPAQAPARDSIHAPARNATQAPARASTQAQTRSPARARPALPPSPLGRTVLERLTEPGSSAPSQAPGSDAVTAFDPLRGKKIRLEMVNAAEDVPRVIRAHAKLGKTQCALVLRPHDGQGLLVHSENGQCWSWTGLSSDVPQRPDSQIDVETAIARLKGAQQELPATGPASLHSAWSGKLFCVDGLPRITLQRKVASYGMLYIASDARGRVWHWRVERSERWFSRPGKQEGTEASLLEAIKQSTAAVMGLLGEACSVRDSRRRAALDPVYAESHPNKLAREGRDPVEKFAPKPPKATRQAAPAAEPTKRERKPRAEASLGGTPTTASVAPQTVKPAKASAPAPRPAPAPAQAPAPTRTRKPRTEPPAPSSTPAATAPGVEEIDPAKDKLLMDAFSDAIGKVMAQFA